MSFGGPEPDAPIVVDAIHKAAADGMLLVAAIGNNDGFAGYPAADLQPPGGARSYGLAVGASDGVGTRASFSNSGRHLSLLAPGRRVGAVLGRARRHGADERVRPDVLLDLHAQRGRPLRVPRGHVVLCSRGRGRRRPRLGGAPRAQELPGRRHHQAGRTAGSLDGVDARNGVRAPRRRSGAGARHEPLGHRLGGEASAWRRIVLGPQGSARRPGPAGTRRRPSARSSSTVSGAAPSRCGSVSTRTRIGSRRRSPSAGTAPRSATSRAVSSASTPARSTACCGAMPTSGARARTASASRSPTGSRSGVGAAAPRSRSGARSHPPGASRDDRGSWCPRDQGGTHGDHPLRALRRPGRRVPAVIRARRHPGDHALLRRAGHADAAGDRLHAR